MLTWLVGAGLVVFGQNLGHASVRNLQLTRDIAGTYAGLVQFDDLLTRGVGQRFAVDEEAAQLIDTGLAEDAHVDKH